VDFKENKVKFDFLNKKSVVYCELLSEPSESWEFDVKIESFSVKVQEVENFMDDESKKEYVGYAEEVDEEKKIEFKKKKIKEDWW